MPMNPRLLRPRASGFDPRSISGLALWLDAADTSSLYTTDAGPVTAVSAPTEISGCVGWWDASDAATITQSGGLVSQWNDKSGQGYHLTASGSARPTTGTRSIGGRNAIDFDGTDDVLALGAYSFNLAATRAATVCVVMASDQPSAVRRVLSLQRTGKNPNDTGLFLGRHTSPTGATEFAIGGGDSTTNDQVDRNLIQGFADNTTAASIYTASVSAAANYARVFAVGAMQSLTLRFGTMPASDFLAFGTGNHTIDIGATRSSGNAVQGFWDGPVAEVIIFNTALSTTDRARVEAYLAAKWGIAGVHAQATATSDPVGYWRDKSGNNRHATQATGASRAAVASVTLNGRKAIGFDGADDRLELPSLDITPATVFGVVRHSTGTSAAARTPFALSEGASYLHAQFIQSGASQMVGLTHNAARSSFSANGVDVLGASFLLSSSQSAGGGGTVGRMNGTDLPYSIAIQDSGGANRIGCRYRNSANDQFWNGQVAEFLIYQSALSSSQITRIERYLAAKWGIVLAPQVSNADAQDWVNRVYANGGTVSSTTASAVNTFCNAIDAAGLRDRFYRLNLFCGTGLAACLVPLYRGPSLGGTQYGNTTDTNNGPFVSGDFSEASGLQGNGSTKYLATGIAQTYAGTNEIHKSLGFIPNVSAGYQCAIGGRYNLSNSVASEIRGANANFRCAAFSSGIATSAYSPSSGRNSMLLNHSSSNTFDLYSRDSLLQSLTLGAYNSATTANFLVFAGDTNGTPSAHFSGSVDYYSIGLRFTSSAQVAAFHNAVAAFRVAMSRT